MNDEFIKIEVRRRAAGSVDVTLRHLGEDGYIYVDSANCDGNEEAASYISTAINGARKAQGVRNEMRKAGRDPLAELQAGRYTGKETQA